MRGTWWVVWCGVVAISCAAQPHLEVDGGDEDAGEPAPLTAAEFCGAGPSVCAALVACGIAQTQRGCERFISMHPLCTRWEEEVDAGRVKFAPEAAASCLAARRACQPPSVACDGAFAGTRGLGAACTDQLECAPRSFCEGLSCPGHCTPRKGAGAIVENFEEECLEGFEPIYGRCSQPIGEGQLCLAQDLPDYATCGRGLFCDAPSRRCMRQRAVNTTCGTATWGDEYIECQWGSMCEWSDGGTVCVGLHGADRHCNDLNCRFDLTCRIVGECVVPELCGYTCQPEAALGEPCDTSSTDAGPTTCRWPTFCGSFDGGTSRCLPPRGLGESCYDPIVTCERNLWCAPFQRGDGGTGHHCLFPTRDGGAQPCP